MQMAEFVRDLGNYTRLYLANGTSIFTAQRRHIWLMATCRTPAGQVIIFIGNITLPIMMHAINFCKFRHFTCDVD